MNALYRVLTLKEAARYLHVRRRVLQRKLPPRYRVRSPAAQPNPT
jgi:hypothetical protein